MAHKTQREDRLADAVKAERFRQTVLAHLDAALTLARYLMPRKDLAEDIVQEATLRAYRGFEDYRGENAKAWLLAIVRNCCYTHFAGEQRTIAEGGNGFSAQGFIDIEADHETPEDLLIQSDDARVIRAAINKVPMPFREVLVLKDIEELSYRQIADVTATPVGTVMSRLARARKMFADVYTCAQGVTGASANGKDIGT